MLVTWGPVLILPFTPVDGCPTFDPISSQDPASILDPLPILLHLPVINIHEMFRTVYYDTSVIPSNRPPPLPNSKWILQSIFRNLRGRLYALPRLSISASHGSPKTNISVFHLWCEFGAIFEGVRPALWQNEALAPDGSAPAVVLKFNVYHVKDRLVEVIAVGRTLPHPISASA